jgi:hypothetical protein
MSIRLGNTTASLYLGSTPVAAYLGAEQVYSAVQAVTLYFNAAVDGDWETVGNWWLDDEHTEPAGRLPTSADSVVVTGATIIASGQTVVNFTLNEGDDNSLFGSLAVTGMATFNGLSFNDGTVTGDATFNDTSANLGTVTGDATFNDSACNSGTVTGTIIGNPPSCFEV